MDLGAILSMLIDLGAGPNMHVMHIVLAFVSRSKNDAANAWKTYFTLSAGPTILRPSADHVEHPKPKPSIIEYKNQ